MCDEDDDLARYHFGEMTEAEHAAFEERLAAEPRLAAGLKAFRRCLADCQEELAPEGLVDRTLDSVRNPCEKIESPCSSSRFSLVELSTVGLVAIALFAIITPAIQSSRSEARRHACEANLHELSQALFAYADNHGDYFPQIAPDENAGRFTLALSEKGYLDREKAIGSLVCPSSSLASRVAAGRVRIYVPTRQELQQAHAQLLEQLQRHMAGSYAYRIGYYDESGNYQSIRNRRDPRSPLLGDAPSRSCRWASSNHGEHGQNVLFQDGHVRFQVHCWLPGVEDHLYLNENKVVAAGNNRHDAVLVRSEVQPGVVKPVVHSPSVLKVPVSSR